KQAEVMIVVCAMNLQREGRPMPFESLERLKPSDSVGFMHSNVEKVLVVEADPGLRGSIVELLKDAGYTVATDCHDGMRSVLGFDPDTVILGANPPQLDCCDLLSEIKGSEHTQNVRVIMLSPGGPAERTRGLDLGADDVLSLPFDRHELLARVRWQLRNKHA